jgi:hypothetical protein
MISIHHICDMLLVGMNAKQIAASSFLSAANTALRAGVMTSLSDRRDLRLDSAGLTRSEV